MKKIIISCLILLCSYQQCFAANYKEALQQVYDKYQTVRSGKNADYIPELAKVNPNYFGIVLMTVHGESYAIGDTDIPFAIESISKLFTYALALEQSGEIINQKVGMNATGRPYNSIQALIDTPGHLQNPMVNAGAIQLTSYIKGSDSSQKWETVLSFMNRFSDRKLSLSKKVYLSEVQTNATNRRITRLLNSFGKIQGNPQDALDRYTKACSVMLTTKQLAIMGATLANDGINPITKERLISKRTVRNTLSQMMINGLYENSGAWWQEIGIPTKSGVGGGMLAVVPGQFAIAVFSPRLNVIGNSVRGELVVRSLSEILQLHLLD